MVVAGSPAKTRTRNQRTTLLLYYYMLCSLWRSTLLLEFRKHLLLSPHPPPPPAPYGTAAAAVSCLPLRCHHVYIGQGRVRVARTAVAAVAAMTDCAWKVKTGLLLLLLLLLPPTEILTHFVGGWAMRFTMTLLLTTRRNNSRAAIHRKI